MSATLSILGLYNYDDTLFDLLQLPDGVDKTTFVNLLLAERAENEILYTNPVIMKNLIGVWSQSRLPIWNKLYNTTVLEYDPISNYDRREEWTDKTTRAGNSSGTVKNSNTDSNTQTNRVAGYNSDELSTAGTQSIEGTHTDAGESTASGNSTEDATRTGRAYGNIGVTTTQQMIEQERNSAQFDIYRYIIDDFSLQFCLLIY